MLAVSAWLRLLPCVQAPSSRPPPSRDDGWVRLRAASSASLDLAPDKVDAVFASNCTDQRVRAMQASATMQAAQEKDATIVRLQEELAQAQETSKQAAEELDAANNLVPEIVRDYLKRQHEGKCPQESMAFSVYAPGSDAMVKSGGGMLGGAADSVQAETSTSNLLALCRMIHIHVVQNDTTRASGGDCPSRILGSRHFPASGRRFCAYGHSRPPSHRSPCSPRECSGQGAFKQCGRIAGQWASDRRRGVGERERSVSEARTRQAEYCLAAERGAQACSW
jgi:hypothetical protein